MNANEIFTKVTKVLGIKATPVETADGEVLTTSDGYHIYMEEGKFFAYVDVVYPPTFEDPGDVDEKPIGDENGYKTEWEAVEAILHSMVERAVEDVADAEAENAWAEEESKAEFYARQYGEMLAEKDCEITNENYNYAADDFEFDAARERRNRY